MWFVDKDDKETLENKSLNPSHIKLEDASKSSGFTRRKFLFTALSGIAGAIIESKTGAMDRVFDHFGKKVVLSKSASSKNFVNHKVIVKYNKAKIEKLMQLISSNITIPVSCDDSIALKDFPEFLGIREYLATRGLKIKDLPVSIDLGPDFESVDKDNKFLEVQNDEVKIYPPPVRILRANAQLDELKEEHIEETDSLFKDVSSIDTINSINNMVDETMKMVLADKQKQKEVLFQAEETLKFIIGLAYPDKKLKVCDLRFSNSCNSKKIS